MQPSPSSTPGTALELAIGTGRIAAPLATHGVPVSGIELSKAMAARIAGKPGGADIDVAIGDMTTTRVPGQFSLVNLGLGLGECLTARPVGTVSQPA